MEVWEKRVTEREREREQEREERGGAGQLFNGIVEGKRRKTHRSGIRVKKEKSKGNKNEKRKRIKGRKKKVGHSRSRIHRRSLLRESCEPRED